MVHDLSCHIVSNQLHVSSTQEQLALVIFHSIYYCK